MLGWLSESFDGLVGLLAGVGSWLSGLGVNSGPGLNPDG